MLPRIGSNEQLTEIEKTLSRKGLGLSFPPRLEAAYEEARGPARNRAIGTFLLVYLAAKLLFLLANLQIGSKVWPQSVSIKASL